jgi:hypothetical protein
MATEDDRFDDRTDDHLDEPRDDDEIIRKAKDAVKGPAIGLLVMAVLGVIAMPLGVYQYINLPKEFEKAKLEFEKNPQMKDDEKQKAKEIMDMIENAAKVGLPASIGLNVIITLISGISGFKLMNLSSPGFVKFGSILTLLPCSGLCCILNLIFGIWPLVTLGKPEVKAGFAAMKRRSAF